MEPDSSGSVVAESEATGSEATGSEATGSVVAESEAAGSEVQVRTWNHRGNSVVVQSPFARETFSRTRRLPCYSVHVSPKKLRIRIARIPVRRTVTPQVRSFTFVPDLVDDSAETVSPPTVSAAEPASVASVAPVADNRPDSPPELFRDFSKGVTRIRVPADVIRIEDRIQYLLQPPIESLLDRKSLSMPFEPFAYQKQGVGFLYSAQFAILADEMGLGKTMQAITTIRLLLRTNQCRRVLLVCPKPLVTNWQREFELWAPEVPVAVIEGKGDRRRWLWQLSDVAVRIANYELLHRDREYFDFPLGSESSRPFDLVVLDESQRIKNKNSVTAEAARAIPRRRNWALTGTPVENSSEDLVGIFEFLSPGYLESGLSPTRICRLVGDHILRRTKDMVMTDLPPKLFRDASIELSGEQWESYRLAKEEGEVRLNEMGDSLTMHHAFELILRLKQICNFDPVTRESAKLERLVADLEEVAQSGRKAIVFSQWVETLLLLKDRLAEFHPLEYHGRIPSKDRDGVIERFRNEDRHSVILMSYGAGSVGLNLQFAQYVFLFDRWWNPAIEDQAINRAHRIGAVGPVTVTRFVTMNTIEEKIDRILAEKRTLSETILSGAKGLNLSLGLNQQEIFSLFNLKRQ